MVAINREALLKEVSADLVCGEDLEYDPAFVELESLAQGKAEQQIGDTVIEAEDADWKQVKTQSAELLSRSKDIRVFVYLIRALLNMDELTSFSHTLAALKELLCANWEAIHPQLDEDDGDPTMRINALITLCDEQAVLLPLRKVSLIKSRMLGTFSLRDISYAVGDTAPPPGYEPVAESTIHGAVMDADVEALQASLQAISECVADVNTIEAFVTEQVGVADAVSFSPLVRVLTEQQRLVSDYLQQRGVSQMQSEQENQADEAETETPTTPGSPAATTASNQVVTARYSAQISSREDVMRALENIESYYYQCEPTSPVPLMINRVKKMVNMNFMEIIKNIAPDSVSQAETLFGPEEEQVRSYQQSYSDPGSVSSDSSSTTTSSSSSSSSSNSSSASHNSSNDSSDGW